MTTTPAVIQSHDAHIEGTTFLILQNYKQAWVLSGIECV
jgi:hypothetical protein